MPKLVFNQPLANHIRSLYFTGLWKQAELAAMYKTRQSHISKIISQEIWSE